MLSPVSLRICWVAAMAPALTEAASQADNFTLPHSPATDKFPSLSLNLGNRGKQSKLSDITQSFATLSQIGANSGGFSKLKKKLTDNCINEDLTLLPWNGVKHKLSTKPVSGNSVKVSVQNGKNGTKVNLRTSCMPDQTLSLHGEKDQCPTVITKQTMNEIPSHIKDTMGLLKANTSLDCELEGKLLSGSQPSDLDREPFLMTPEDTRLQTDDYTFRSSPVRNPGLNFVLRSNAPSDKTRDVLPHVSPVQIESSSRRNMALKTRTLQLVGRIRRLQARQTEFHVKEQLKAFVEHQQVNLGIPCLLQKPDTSHPLGKIQNSEDLLHSENVKNLSTAALVSLVRKLESSQHGKYVFNNEFQENEKVAVKLNPAECAAIKRTSTKLHRNLNYLERALDSEATASSSSDESGAEDTQSQLSAPSTSGRKRASWRWAVERASVASRWIWLQTQISDLEYRIRQQADVYKHLRANKGSVALVDQTPTRKTLLEDRLSSESNNKISYGSQGIHLTSSIDSKVVNGFRPFELGNGYGSAEKSDDGRGDLDSSRTRPLKSFRKRKLVRTLGLHLTNRKVARLASVKCTCNCQRELLPCIICGGRYNSTRTLDPDVMPLQERIALLDTSFHPVLSFRHDACLGIRYEKILRKCEFSKSAEKGGLTFKRRRFAISLADQARKHNRKLTKNAAQTLLSSAKLRKSYGAHRRFPRSDHRDYNHQPRNYLDSSLASMKSGSDRMRSYSVSSNGSSKPASPVPSPVPSISGDAAVEVQEHNVYRGPSSKVSTLHELLRRRRFENAFDINNIVIPHSIASATRVEKLQYKEILTPKWRVFHEPEPSNSSENTMEVLEDLTDETFVSRHLKCEDEERKKFRIVTNPGHGRSRLRSGRMDSRADSSGANTPDPMSPYPADSSSNQEASCYGYNSPVASPPPTPSSVSVLDEHSMLGIPAIINRERRRTLSLSKRVSEDEHQFYVEEYFAVPYEPRVFPLADDEYVEMLSTSPHLEDAIHSEAASVAPSVASEEAGNSLSRPQSPGNSSSIGSMPEEDPNDPEWTVITGTRNRKPSIILKLSKR